MKSILFASVLAIMFLTGCSNADQSAIGAWGQSHHIKQFSGGQIVGEWDSTGKIENEDHSDGYYFQDKATGKMVTISGNVQITLN